MKLIEKVPEFLNENVEINAFFDAIEPEIDLLVKRTQQINKNIYPETADSDGIKTYEEWLGIPLDRTLNLNQRRGQVLARLNETLPFTEIRLQRLLAGIVGWGHFEYYRKGAFIRVTLDPTCFDTADTVYQLLMRILPLNAHFELRLNQAQEESTVLFGIGGQTTEVIETPISLEEKTATIKMTSGSIETEIIETKESEEI